MSGWMILAAVVVLVGLTIPATRELTIGWGCLGLIAVVLIWFAPIFFGMFFAEPRTGIPALLSWVGIIGFFIIGAIGQSRGKDAGCVAMCAGLLFMISVLVIASGLDTFLNP